LQEIKKVIQNLRNNKAPGKDAITEELTKYGANICME
jgi:hypothetical protein